MGWLPGLAGCCCCGPAGGTGGGYSVGAVAHRDAIGRMQMPQGRCSGPVLPQASSVIRGELFLLCGFLWRDPLGNLEPRNGRGPVTNMERPLEGGGRCLDLDNTARQFQDLIARRRPRRTVNGTDLDGRAFAEHTPPAPAEFQASCGERRHADLPPAGQPGLVSVDDPEPAPDAT
jgi:hypothetical protein